MIKQDDRTPEQRKTHIWGVVMRDKFLSGWGEAEHGYSRCAWAVEPGVDIGRVERWVRSRGDAQYVGIIRLDTYRAPRGTAHFHIYVADKNHPAAKY